MVELRCGRRPRFLQLLSRVSGSYRPKHTSVSTLARAQLFHRRSSARPGPEACAAPAGIGPLGASALVAQSWLGRLAAHSHPHVAAVALANKNARIAARCSPTSASTKPITPADFLSPVDQAMARGAYVNRLGETSEDLVRLAYGANYPRLVAIKKNTTPETCCGQTRTSRPPEDPAGALSPPALHANELARRARLPGRSQKCVTRGNSTGLAEMLQFGAKTARWRRAR
jgi:hypothetical protein